MNLLTIEDYIITKDGKIINKKTNRIIKLELNAKGYYRVTIGGKRYFVHRLVAEKFLPNPFNKSQVNHKNGIKTDNRIENLEWVSNEENRQHAIDNGLHLCGENCSWSKLKENDVIFIRNNINNINKKELSKMFNISISTINDILNYRSWKKVKS